MKAIHVYEQGGRHRAADKPCQDRTFYLEQDGVSAIALADGAGNERYTHSEYGAECVTRTIARFLCRNFDKICDTEEERLRFVIERVCQEKLRDKAGELGLSGIEPLSSTLLAAAVKGDTLILCHVGDGVIGGIEKGVPVVLSGPENGEFASTTFFIASPGAAGHVRVIVRPVEELESVFLMSDGTADYTFDESGENFTKGVVTMAAMAYEENGEQQLRRTIRDFMTEKDSRSDDCSFAVLPLKEGHPAAASGTGAAGAESPEEAGNEHPPIIEEENPETKETESVREEKSRKNIMDSVLHSRTGVLVTAAVVFLVFAAAGVKLAGSIWNQEVTEEIQPEEETGVTEETEPGEKPGPGTESVPSGDPNPVEETEPPEEAKPADQHPEAVTDENISQPESGEVGQDIRETVEQIEEHVELTGQIKEKLLETEKSLERMLGEGTYRIFHKIK